MSQFLWNLNFRFTQYVTSILISPYCLLERKKPKCNARGIFICG